MEALAGVNGHMEGDGKNLAGASRSERSSANQQGPCWGCGPDKTDLVPHNQSFLSLGRWVSIFSKSWYDILQGQLALL